MNAKLNIIAQAALIVTIIWIIACLVTLDGTYALMALAAFIAHCALKVAAVGITQKEEVKYIKPNRRHSGE